LLTQKVALTPGLAAQDPERALDLALELPERVARADDRRMVLFFDEFQEVASARRPYGDPDAVTNRRLRDAGVAEHQARGRWRIIDPLLRHYLVALDPFAS
jgi:hypothetical protein